MQEMVNFTLALLPEDPASCKLLDVGTGNGVLALELAARGCKCVTGSDYSQASVQLAAAIAAQRGDTSTRWLLDDILDTRLQPGCVACTSRLIKQILP